MEGKSAARGEGEGSPLAPLACGKLGACKEEISFYSILASVSQQFSETGSDARHHSVGFVLLNSLM